MNSRKSLPIFVLAVLLGLSCVRAFGLRISEVLYDLDASVISDSAGEWIEIFNETISTSTLTGFKIGDEETNGRRGRDV